MSPSSSLAFLWLHGCLCSTCWSVRAPEQSRLNPRMEHGNGRDTWTPHQRPRCLCDYVCGFYGLPQSGRGCWLGRDRCAGLEPPEQTSILIQAMNQHVQEKCGYGIASRFVPFVTMHEFEGLLFSKPGAMANGMGVRNWLGSSKTFEICFLHRST